MNEKVSRFKVALPASGGGPTFSIGLRPRNAQPDGPQTLPGRMAEQTSRGLQQQLDALRAEREDGRVILLLDPKDIVVTEFANRHAKSLADDDPRMIQLVQSIKAHGQDNPVTVRPAAEGSACQYEIVDGHRRLAACLSLDRATEGGFQIKAALHRPSKDAQQLVLKMYRENEERFDLSGIEKGLMFKKWIDAALFPNGREIAAAVNLSEQVISKYLALASLPEFILEAFVDVREIPVRAASSLTHAVSSAAPAVQKEAARLARLDPRPAADAVVQALCTVAARVGKPRKTVTTQELSVRIKGKVPLKIAMKGNRISLKLQHLEPATQKQFSEELQEWSESWFRKRFDK